MQGSIQATADHWQCLPRLVLVDTGTWNGGSCS
jgi:hypothetical protein